MYYTMKICRILDQPINEQDRSAQRFGIIMSLVSANYASSSDDEPKGEEKKKKRAFTSVVLPPEIVEALEQDVESDDNDERTIQHRKHRKNETAAVDPGKTLSSRSSFLPKPKHSLPLPHRFTSSRPTSQKIISSSREEMSRHDTSLVDEATFIASMSEDNSSKQKRRRRDRMVERALQSGDFDALTEVREVHGVTPNKWRPLRREDMSELRGNVSQASILAYLL